VTTHPYLVGLIGTGVTPSLTPALHMAEAAAHGLRYVYRPIDLSTLDLSPADLPTILTWAERLGFDAVNVTHPCKQTVLAHLDRVDPVAAGLGSVNTVLFTPDGRIGHNTDTTGFENAVRHGLPGADLRRVVQVGAGGAGSAVADALLRLGAGRLDIVDVDMARASALAGSLSSAHVGAAVEGHLPDALPGLLADAVGVVNCTPIGMHDHPGSPFPLELLRPDLWVADVVYRPLETPLLAAARRLGATVLDGGHMAVHQAVDAFSLITGLRPDAGRMATHFRTLVASDASTPLKETSR